MSTFDTSLKMFTSQIQARFKFNILALAENNIREAYKIRNKITLVATSSCSNKILQ